MLGYVAVDKGELKVREYEIYTGYYCGICKYIGSAWGQVPRISLSYDAAFLAILLASLDPAPDAPVQEHCIVHPVRKKTIIYDPAIEYAGDVMLILAWHKLRDDAEDEGKTYAKAMMALLGRHYRRLLKRYPGLCRSVEENLNKLQALEKENCDNLDQAAEAFAKIMEKIFARGATELYGDREKKNPPSLHETFGKIGYHMGKWIYLIDAADDIESDLKAGTYNPLLTRFSYGENESPENFRDRIDERLRFNLFHYLAVVGESLETLELEKNSGIIKNVVYLGMNRKTEEVLRRLNPKKTGLAGIIRSKERP